MNTYNMDEYSTALMDKVGLGSADALLAKESDFLIEVGYHEKVPMYMDLLREEDPLEVVENAQNGGALIDNGPFDPNADLYIQEDDGSIYSLVEDDLVIWFSKVIEDYDLEDKFIDFCK